MIDERDSASARPTWWAENSEYKRWLDLPSYDPPRFSDGTYTHEVVEPLERRHDCSIRFVSVDPEYGADWQVRIDRTARFTIGRHRDDRGNTVYEVSASEFVAKVTDAIESQE